MKQFDWYDFCERLYQLGGRKTFHVNELAEIAEQAGILRLGDTPESLAKELSGYLSRNVRSRSPAFAKVKNGQGGFRKGVYRIKTQKSLPLTPVVKQEISTSYTGKAGEFAVLSELLFRGFNASIMTVDEGIDIVASKNGRYFHIQVKTSNYNDGKPYSTSFKSKTLQSGADVFYIVVLRQPTQFRFLNDYMIFPSSDLRRWRHEGIIKEGHNISLRIANDHNRFILNKSLDVSSHLNDFDVINLLAN